MAGGPSVPGLAGPGLAVPGLAGSLGPPGTGLVGTWTGTQAIGTGTGTPSPPSFSLRVPVANTGKTGYGMVAFAEWTIPSGYLGTDMAVTDDAHNVWWPLGAPQTSSSATGLTRSAIWACPGAFAAANVYAAPCGLPGPCYPAVTGLTVAEFSGMSPYLGTPLTATAVANGGTVVAAGIAPPGASALMLAVGTSDGSSAPPGPGTGWNAITGVSGSGGGFSLNTSPAWQVATVGAYDTVIAADTPSAWWKLADPAGSAVAADSSGNGNTGTPAAVTFGTAGIIAGDTAASFASASSSIITTSFNPAPAAGISAEAWVNLNSLSQGTSPRLLSNSATATDHKGFELRYNGSTRALIADAGNGTTFTEITGGTIPATGWAYCAFTWDGTTMLLYLNGVQVASGALSGTPQAGSANMRVGSNGAAGGIVNGIMAQAAVYGYALTAAQVANHFANAPGIALPTWTASPAADLSAATAQILLSNPAPYQPSVNWPAFSLQAGFGSGALTPPGQVAWTDLSARWMAGRETSSTAGKQYELGQLQAGEINAILQDNDGALTPGFTGSPYWPNVTSDTPVRLVAWWAQRTYCPWAALAERLPPAWDSEWFGLTEMTAADVWAVQQNQLDSVLREETLWDPNLTHYWVCSDPAGSASAQNIAPANPSSPLIVTISKNGAVGSNPAQAFGSGAVGPTSAALLGGDQSGTFWSQSGMTSGSEGYGWCLFCTDQNYPLISGGVTISGWFAPSGSTQIQNTAQQLILVRGSNAAKGPSFQVQLASPAAANPGALQVTVWDQSTSVATTTTVSTANWLLAGMFHVTLLLSQSTWTLWANGVNQGNGTANLPPAFSWLTFMGCADRFATTSMLNGQCGHLAVYSVQLQADRIRSTYLAGVPSAQVPAGGGTAVAVTGAQFAGEFPAQRIERLLAYGGWTGTRAISQASVTPIAGISDIQGSSVSVAASGQLTVSSGGQQSSQAVTNINFTDGGYIHVDGPTGIHYVSRADLFTASLNPPAWTLGELTASGEIPYQPDAVIGFDKSQLFTIAQLTAVTSVAEAPVIVENVPAFTRHGGSVFNANAYHALVAQIIDLAEWIVNTRGIISLRVQECTVNAAANPSAWPFLLGVQPAQAVTVNRRPQLGGYQFGATSVTCQVTRTIDFQAGVALCKITTDMYPEGSVYIIGDPLRGVANGLNTLGWL